ncbi:histidine kinase dimerization/phospho-acceptor domain-containing protein [Spirulina major CS-329]|uniref:sensor histidine kinase n=1 Tax=Spirulina TaxID=1154 RepID=UPI00232EE4B3|nr:MULTISPECIES: histidine kinase dimerization/phospho-acceptor domain-containing protein [Spirulina]MDB9493097.1 histidine kinase dimerization/phospho-acceptor domain-containing protein [Spirulina subsalsa CS-330]MDB9503089.1 histidine kinase dimerization/phospho-acceptor domain-containing protein [Spirulina major CS-329]
MQVLVIGDDAAMRSLIELMRSNRHHITVQSHGCPPPAPPFYPLILLQADDLSDRAANLCRQIHQTHPYTTLIAVLDHINAEHIQTLLNCGVNDYLLRTAPPTEQKLRLKVIEHNLQRRPLTTTANPLAKLGNRPGPSDSNVNLKSTALSQFPYLASHHLRQTLIQIRKQLNTLLAEPHHVPLEPSTTAYLNQIIDRANMMQQMLSDVLIDTQSHLQNPLLQPPITHQDYVILDHTFTIQEYSNGVQRYAEDDTTIQEGIDIRDSFPEVAGLELILAEILNYRHEGYEISGIARFSETEFPLYFDLYISVYPHKRTIGYPAKLIILLNNATERMLFQQRLIQSANEAQLLLKKLATAKNYITQIINSMADALVVTTKSGVIKTINAATQKLFGYEDYELINQPISKLVDDQSFLGNLAQGQLKFQAEVICRQRNGQVLYVSFSCGVIETEDDTQDFVCVGRDVTKQKKAEAQINALNVSLQQRTIELENVNDELESFSRTVSHDLRTPISHIEFFNQMLREEYGDVLNEEGQDYLVQIQNSCGRMRQLIHDLLQLSRSTRMELTLDMVDLSTLAQQISAALKMNTPERQVTFILEPNLTVQGNESLLRIALENLFNNAWKYTSKRSQSQIQFGQCRDPDIYSQRQISAQVPIFFVQDDGAGFDMSYADKLFHTFARLHSQSEFEGTGIGLTIVQRILERHGGTIWAKGVVGEGATFYFTITPAMETLNAEVISRS